MKLALALEKLFEDYDKARSTAKDAKREQEDLNKEIKARLDKEKLDVADTPSFTCVYKYDKDTTDEVFDEAKFAEKEPKKFQQYTELMDEMKKITKKYTKTVVTKGARKLVVTRKNEDE